MGRGAWFGCAAMNDKLSVGLDMKKSTVLTGLVLLMLVPLSGMSPICCARKAIKSPVPVFPSLGEAIVRVSW